jgi:outer membrane biosynthesis protein TonB
MNRLCRATVLLVLGVGLGCATTPPNPPTPARQGESSYRVLAEAEVTAGTPEPSTETITAILPFAENRPPSYPDTALRSGCSDGLVPVRVHVGIDGRVSEILRIPGRAVSDDACHNVFEDSVRRALGAWGFIPAYRIRQVPAEGPGKEPAVERVPLGLDVDYEFVFTVVDGKGTVRSR